MAQCPKCRKQVPDEAVHCGYCGASLHAPALAEKKTMFGYAAMQPQEAQAPAPQPSPARHPEGQLPAPSQPAPARAAPSQPAPARVAPIQSAPAPSAPIQPPAADPGAPRVIVQPAAGGRGPRLSPVEAMAKTQYGAESEPAQIRRVSDGQDRPVPSTLMQQGMPAPASLRRSQAHESQPRADLELPATRFPEAQVSSAPRQVIPATVAALPSQPAMVPATIIAAAAPAGGREPSRPVLASESLAEDRAPAEPGRTAMRVLMAIGGLLLIGLFVAPFGQSYAGLRFSWHLIPTLKGFALANQLCVGAAGVLFLAAALLPVPFLARALTGAVLGAGALGLVMAAGGGDWRFVATVSVCFLLPAGLLHRWRYRASLFARLLVAVCVLAVLATLLVPSGGSVPLLLVFEGLGSAGAAAAVARLMPLLLLLLALLSLLAFLGSGSTGLSQVWAVGLLFYLPLQSAVAVLLSPEQEVWAHLKLLYSGLALLVYLTLAAHGLSQIMAAASRGARS